VTRGESSDGIQTLNTISVRTRRRRRMRSGNSLKSSVLDVVIILCVGE